MKTFYSILVFTCIFYVSSFAQISLPFRTLDTTLLVGATQGSADVSGSGAATYNIPIFVSPGTAGMQPSVSIVYNSQATNGVLGVGWNIAGLSAITRVGKDYYHDSEVKGVSLTAGDRFEWDGNRLYSKGGTYGANGTAYATESESFAKIISNSQAGNGPESFTITTKDGTILTYGATADSRIEAPGSSTVLLWRLSQVKDINGNYIKYYYNEYSGDSYIDRIEYTGNETTGLLPYNKLKFTYEDRPDKSMYYLCGAAINQTKRLISIDMICENTTPSVRRYDFIYLPIDTYGPDYIKSRLSQVKETANGVKSINPTVINWGTATATQSVISVTTTTTGNASQSFFNDLNGDGRTDQFILSGNTGDQYNFYYTHWAYYQSDGNTLQFSASGNIAMQDSCTGAFIADMNNDGKAEIFLDLRHTHTQTTCNPCVQPLIVTQTDQTTSLEENTIGTISPMQYIPPTDTCCITTTSYPHCGINHSIVNNSLVRGSENNDYHWIGKKSDEILTGQINSDGKTDLITLKDNNNLDNLIVGFTLNAWPHFDYPDKTQLLDFDGDGLDEIFVLKTIPNSNFTSYKIFKYDEVNKIFSIISNGTLEGATSTNYKTGDFNGDGKTDIIVHNYGQVKFSIFQSTGAGFAAPINFFKNSTWDDAVTNTESNFYVLDLNGDGKDDIIDFYSKLSVCLTGINYDENCVLNGSPGFVKYISKGAGVLSLYGVQKISDNLTGKEIRVDFADIDGDGMKDATLMVNPSKWTETPSFNGAIYKNYANTQRYRVYNISNGMNQAVGFTYTSLAAANSTLYTKGKSSQFPVIDIQPAQFVVASLISHAGYKNGSNYVYSVTDFSYKGARSHMQGRGYLGFDTLVSVNSLSGIKTESVYGINTPYYFRYPVVTNSYVSNVATGIKTTNFVTQGRGTSGYYSYPASSTSTDLLSNTTVTHKCKFDNYGNMTSDTTIISSDAVVATNNTYAIVGDSAVPNKLSTTKTSSQYTGRAAFVTYKTFGYDAKGNLITTVDFADQAKPITSAYTLNNYGMPESTTVSAPGVTPRTSRTNYDTKYRLPVRSINALGYKSARTFNYALGVPLADSLANGLQTTYAYDEFGRLKSTTVPQGYSITQNMNWSRTGDPSGTIFSSTTTTPGKPTVKTCYDILGRAIRSEQNGFNNKKLTADFNYVPASPYGKAGLLTSQTYPYYTNETPETVSYKYDAYGRVTETNDRGMATLTAYSGKTVTTTNPSGQVTSKTVNAMGNLLLATDNGGTINYQYHSSGQPISIAAVGATTTIEYDAYGRQVKLIDPDAGTTKYTYNAFGELASQTNANNKNDTLQYDILGRLVQKKTGSDITSYLYNNSGRAIGQPISVTAPNGSKEEYTYDTYGRTSSIKQSIPGHATPFTTTYTYDMYGNNTKIKYPETGYAVLNNFDAQGRLVKVTDTLGATIWQLTDVSSHGLPLSTNLGNGLNTYYGYDMDQVTYITTGISAVGTVQSENYGVSHPDIGNIEGRRDNIAGQNESFTYDNFNRLANIIPDGFPAPPPGEFISITTDPEGTNNLKKIPVGQQITYSANGNISSKYNGGTYAYDPIKVHAVKTVTKTEGTVQQQLQNITYTSFNKADSISQTNIKTNKTLKYKITYGPDEQRIKTVFTDTITGNPVTTRYYAGAYEKETTTAVTKQIHYIMGGTGLVAVYIKWPITNKDTLYYVCTDRQGSITALVRQDKSVAEKYSYDAWGRRRNPANWTDFNVKTPRLINRGYTGHEYLDAFGLINMNGRMYDPVIGRVLSPDNYVQDPTNTQSYNRYSYCLNNPLRYTDPSGWFAAAADQYWNMGKDITDFISFSGMRAGSLDGTGGGQGWGGVGGVLPQGIHWMPKSLPKGVTVDDLMGSLWNATPFDGKQYNYDNVDGELYNTSTTTYSFSKNAAKGHDGAFHSVPPPMGDVFFKQNVEKLNQTQIENQCLATIFSYITKQLCGIELNEGSLIQTYCEITHIGIGVAWQNGLLFTMEHSGTIFNEFFDSFFTRAKDNTVLDAINNGHPVFSSRGGLNHAVVIVGYNIDGEYPIYIYCDPSQLDFQRATTGFDSIIIPISGCK